MRMRVYRNKVTGAVMCGFVVSETRRSVRLSMCGAPRSAAWCSNLYVGHRDIRRDWWTLAQEVTLPNLNCPAPLL